MSSRRKQFITSGRTPASRLYSPLLTRRPQEGHQRHHRATDSAGYVVTRIEEKLGQHASDTAQIALENCRVPVANLLGAEGAGYRIALSNLEGGRISIARSPVGMAAPRSRRRSKYAHERSTFGKPIIEHQAVNFRLADMATQIEAARQMVLHAATLRDAAAALPEGSSMAKLFASEMAEKVCSDAIQIHGGYGYVTDFPVERIYRDGARSPDLMKARATFSAW